MPKSKKPKKKKSGGQPLIVRQGKKAFVQQAKVHQQQMEHRVEQIASSVINLQKQTDINRLGIVAINQLMTGDGWPKELTKTRQFIFGLVSFLREKYPTLLEEVHRYIKDKNFQQIEAYIGNFDIKIGYSTEDFKEMCNKGFIESYQQAVASESSTIDEQGSEEEARKKFEAYMSNIDKKSHLDPEFVGRLGNALNVEYDEEVVIKSVDDEDCLAGDPNAPKLTVDTISKYQKLSEEAGCPLEGEAKEIVDKCVESLEIKDFNLEKTCEMCGNLMQRSEYKKMSDYSWNQKNTCNDKCKRELKKIRKNV